MMKVDSSAATEEEKTASAITKLRYMEFREQLSSSRELGFRIEAVKMKNSNSDNSSGRYICK